MSEEGIPDDIRRFVLQNIDSVAQLEALLLLRSQPQLEWDVRLMAQRLYISPNETIRILAALTAQGLCELIENGERKYRYQPASPDIRALIEKLAEVYSQRLVAISQLIHQRSSSKNNAQGFADAFRLRKDKEE